MNGHFDEPYKEWLYFANCQLTQADTIPDRNRLFRYENLCYNAGLAVELAIKAYFVALKVNFEKTHDLAFLLDELSQYVDIPEDMYYAGNLTKFAVDTKYPINSDPVPITEPEYIEILSFAKHFVNWVTNEINPNQDISNKQNKS